MLLELFLTLGALCSVLTVFLNATLVTSIFDLFAISLTNFIILKNKMPLSSSKPFLYPAIEKAWHGKPAQRTSAPTLRKEFS